MLKLVIEEYTTFAENTLENAIKKEFSGNIAKALTTMGEELDLLNRCDSVIYY